MAQRGGGGGIIQFSDMSSYVCDENIRCNATTEPHIGAQTGCAALIVDGAGTEVLFSGSGLL